MNLLDHILLVVFLEILGPKIIQDPIFYPTYFCNIPEWLGPLVWFWLPKLHKAIISVTCCQQVTKMESWSCCRFMVSGLTANCFEMNPIFVLVAHYHECNQVWLLLTMLGLVGLSNHHVVKTVNLSHFEPNFEDTNIAWWYVIWGQALLYVSIMVTQINQKQQIMHNNQRFSIAIWLCEF